MSRLSRLLIAAAFCLGALPGPGRERAFVPALDPYLSWLAEASPALYQALSGAEPARVFCGATVEYRASAAALLPAARLAAPAPGAAFPSVVRPVDDRRSFVVTEAAPRLSAPSFDVVVPPPRPFLP